ncbi:MAG: DNA polymerase III subunit beta [Chloroflexota bacterium]|nr:DNA polymerase III subunit beta [Chloroflexota bacterium]NOG65499.1 DNA polymerase III subunit beta [Chloroflexota bacterium]GIK65349.1 MAG: DNA polymerase III subunit beta [Chloroflexota bacterium]
MRVSVLQENLQKGLSIVNRAISSRPTLPILANVLLSTEDSRLKLSATNLELGISVWIGAKVEQDGAVTVPARTLYELVSNLSPERVDMELEVRTQTVNLRCGGTTTNIKGIDASEFPLIPEASADGVAVPAHEFREMIEQVAFAAAKDDNRPVLTGILARFENNVITLASADGYRLSVRKAYIENPVKQVVSVIIPAKALQEVARIISDEDELIYISMPEGRSQVMFHLAEVDVVSSLIEGKFPDYEGIIPRKKSTLTTVYRDELLLACKRSEVFARDNAFTTKISIIPSDDGVGPGEMRVRGQSNEKGDNESLVTASVDGTSVDISFNIRYLIDVLNVIKEDQVVIETNTSTDPGVVRPMRTDDDGLDHFVHVIMPMRGG